MGVGHTWLVSDHDSDELNADDPATYLKITKMRETAESVHGRETIERVTEEYRQIRAELQTRPPYERRHELQREAARLEQTYGYEVLAGVPRLTRGSHPRHDWNV
jgi:hypothetical protein